ncbi:uncharacterized protein LOC132194026 [Neocloeon triangulifer]|uniref:uncharacterized protein LOC132194026 n=1 Tax=Neocloeon triangulifer TaxID=2078957 RepID=UPI00286FA2B3|nr:uncharacterized protein LOC132194026 [Neocloeon triangulifer]
MKFLVFIASVVIFATLQTEAKHSFDGQYRVFKLRHNDFLAKQASQAIRPIQEKCSFSGRNRSHTREAMQVRCTNDFSEENRNNLISSPKCNTWEERSTRRILKKQKSCVSKRKFTYARKTKMALMQLMHI